MALWWAQSDSIIKSVDIFNWEGELGFVKDDPNKQVKLLTDALLNIFSNFIPNDFKVVKPQDPPWMAKFISHTYRKYTKADKLYRKCGCPSEQNTQLNSLNKDISNQSRWKVIKVRNRHKASLGCNWILL